MLAAGDTLVWKCLQLLQWKFLLICCRLQLNGHVKPFLQYKARLDRIILLAIILTVITCCCQLLAAHITRALLNSSKLLFKHRNRQFLNVIRLIYLDILWPTYDSCKMILDYIIIKFMHCAIKFFTVLLFCNHFLMFVLIFSFLFISFLFSLINYWLLLSNI